MTRHCIGQTFIVYLQEGNPVTTKMLFKLFSTGVKEEKQADEFLFCF